MLKLIGQKFGRLIVLKRMNKDKQGNYCWLCKCDCKKETIILGSSLRSGNTKSCGCLQKEIVTKHGHNRGNKQTKIYQSWRDMIQRCTNPNHKYYKDYGGRGITVCKRWLKFENFNEDMGKSWKPGLTIERRKNKEGYSPENCYWATRTEQQRNTRYNRLITCFNKTQLLIEWSEETGIPSNIILWRINHGWPPEKALTEPVKKRKKRKERDNG